MVGDGLGRVDGLNFVHDALIFFLLIERFCVHRLNRTILSDGSSVERLDRELAFLVWGHGDGLNSHLSGVFRRVDRLNSERGICADYR